MSNWIYDNMGKLLIAGFVLFLIGAYFASVASDEEQAVWLATLAQKRVECLEAHESAFTCETYVASLDAQRSAKQAKQAATAAVAVSSFAAGAAAGRR